MNEQQAKMKAYSIIAKFYDSLMTGRKYETWSALIAEVAYEQGLSRGVALDLACGTGRITQMLVDLGLKAEGLDLSPSMLEVARVKHSGVHFHEGDVREFSLPWLLGNVELVTCFYDSLNYLLTPQDMEDAFERVYEHLSPGGLFLFDMNTKEHVQASQSNNPRVYEDEELFAIFRSSGDEGIWQLDMDFFVKAGDCYLRSTERHLERGYNEEDISPLLKKAGLGLAWVRTESRVYEDGVERPSRLYFLAQKA